MKLFKQRAITTTRLYFFSSRVTNQWNNLPQEIISATSLSAFKYKLDNHWKNIGYGQNQSPPAY